MIREGGSYEEETCKHDFMCGYGGVHGYGVRGGKVSGGAGAVSYTHLDVYKRQRHRS